jgi:lysophospholipase L1-like esterase
MKRVLLSLCVTVLAGCGRTGERPAPGPMAWVPHPVTVIQMFGDSTTQGSGAPRDQSEPAWLQTMVPADVLVVNEGVSATTATELLEGRDGVHPRFERVMAKSPAHIVTIQFGLNDAVRSTPEQFESSLSRLVEIVAEAGKIPVLQEPNASCLTNRARLPEYVAIVRKVAEQRAVPLVKQYEAYPQWRAHLKDCLHPDGAYYKIKARNTFNAVNAYLMHTDAPPHALMP